MALLFATVTFFNQKKEYVQFKEVTSYDSGIAKLTALMHDADIVVRVDYLSDQSFDKFWELAHKVQYNFEGQARHI